MVLEKSGDRFLRKELTVIENFSIEETEKEILRLEEIILNLRNKIEETKSL